MGQRISKRPATSQSVEDFYTIYRAGVEPDAFESWLRNFETEAGKAFAAILRDGEWPPTREHRLAMSAWIGLQFLREQNKRRSVAEMYRSLSKLEVGMATTDQLRKNLGLPEDTPDDQVERTRADMLATADTQPVDHHVHLTSIENVLDPATQAMFERGPWVLIDFPSQAIGTSDIEPLSAR
jgi:hypothetical protein